MKVRKRVFGFWILLRQLIDRLVFNLCWLDALWVGGEIGG